MITVADAPGGTPLGRRPASRLRTRLLAACPSLRRLLPNGIAPAWIGIVVALGLGSPGPARGVLQQDTVTLLLRYDHQVQFAGYYVALWDGLYRERGIAVEILPGVNADGTLVEVGPRLAAGSVDFGIMGAEALIQLADGAPITLLAPIFQRSAVVAFFHADAPVTRPRDLVGLRIGAGQTIVVDAEVAAMLAADGVPPWRVPMAPPAADVPVTDYIAAFLDGEFDVLPAYELSVSWMARDRGIELRALRPVDWGVESYGDALFARSVLVEQRPELVEAFVEASLEGWRRALARGESVADRIAAELPRTVPVSDVVEYNRFLLPIVEDLVLPEVVPLGTIDLARWNRLSARLYAAGLLDGPLDMARHYFDPAAERARHDTVVRRRIQQVSWLALAVVGTGLVIVAILRGRERERRLALELRIEQGARLESLGRLAGGVAHDFNNILTVIKGHTTLILADMPESSPSRRDAAEILRAADRARALAGRLLAFGRRQSMDRRQIVVADVVRGLRPMLERLVPASIELVVNVHGDGLTVHVDPSQLEQVIMNLVLNAADAIEGAGRIEVTVDPAPRNATRGVDVGDGPPHGWVRLRVSDTGRGISADDRVHIFEPFFTTRSDAGGTGLGLSIVDGIVRQNDGLIFVDTRQGEGTTFTILLPVSVAEAGAAASGPAPNPGEISEAANGAVVLVVEDEDGIRNVVGRVLERAGYRVVLAGGAREALALAGRSGQRIDVVVSDVVMPDMNGAELLSGIRQLRPEVATVLTSGYAPEEIAPDIESLDTLYLAKPFSPEDLLATVRLALGDGMGDKPGGVV